MWQLVASCLLLEKTVCGCFCAIGRNIGCFTVLDCLADFFADGIQFCLVARVYGRVAVTNLGPCVFALVIRERTIDACAYAVGDVFAGCSETVQFFIYTVVGNFVFSTKSVFWQSGDGAAELLEASLELLVKLELLLNKLSYAASV